MTQIDPVDPGGFRAPAFRAAETVDAGHLFAIHVAAVRAGCAASYSAEQLSGWFLNRNAAEYRVHAGRGHLFVAELDGMIAGFTECPPGRIDRLFVRPDLFGRGLGGAILRFALVRAGAAHRPVRVEATLNAVPFYARHGFGSGEAGAFRQPSGVMIATRWMERPLTPPR